MSTNQVRAAAPDGQPRPEAGLRAGQHRDGQQGDRQDGPDPRESALPDGEDPQRLLREGRGVLDHMAEPRAHQPERQRGGEPGSETAVDIGRENTGDHDEDEDAADRREAGRPPGPGV